MEELKIIVDMIASLPQMALWVLIGFWCYKVIVIGSVYGVIRLGINKLYDWLTKAQDVNLSGLVVAESVKFTLIAQLSRVPSRYTTMDSVAVDWLRQAIDDKLVKDANEK